MSNDACSSPGESAVEVLEFWFGNATDPENVSQRTRWWFRPDQSVDAALRERFGGLHDRAAAGEFESWTGRAETALALVLVLDQFSRNLYRGTASAFAHDARALSVVQHSIDRHFDGSLDVVKRAFLYMPFQHSETLEDQRRSVVLFQSLLDDCPISMRSFAVKSYEFALLHHDLVQRFGRFPHRNEPLGRGSTDDEQHYLEQGGHRFGQG